MVTFTDRPTTVTASILGRKSDDTDESLKKITILPVPVVT